MINAIKAAIGDAVLTSMWIFCASSLGVLTSVLSSAAGVYGLTLHPLLIVTTLVFLLVFIFNIIGAALGGASFNPTGTAAFYAAGVVPTSLFAMAIRFPAQVSFCSLFASVIECEILWARLIRIFLPAFFIICGVGT